MVNREHPKKMDEVANNAQNLGLNQCFMWFGSDPILGDKKHNLRISGFRT